MVLIKFKFIIIAKGFVAIAVQRQHLLQQRVATEVPMVIVVHVETN